MRIGAKKLNLNRIGIWLADSGVDNDDDVLRRLGWRLGLVEEMEPLWLTELWRDRTGWASVSWLRT